MGNGPSTSRPSQATPQYPPAPRSREQQNGQATPQYPPAPRSREQQNGQATLQYPPPPQQTRQQQPGYTNGQYYGGYNQQPAQNPQYPGPQQIQYQPPPTYRQPPSQPPPRPVPATQEYKTTATIRNQVNLKKQTLAVTPLPGNAGLLSINFTFDASAACRVTTFVCAREDPKANCKMTLVPSQQQYSGQRLSPAPAVRFDKGLEHKFPQGGDPNGHVIDTSLFSHKELCDLAPGAETFPLVIRLEALTDQGRAEGKSLDDLPVGGETPRWVQSQTTYAKLAREEGNTWEVRVIKQKIWVNGEAYELQEIYGMEQNRTVTGIAAGFDDVDGNECVICMSAPRDTTALPCRHMCMCHGCASALKTQTNKCPICRNEIESLLHIKITKGTPVKPAVAAE